VKPGIYQILIFTLVFVLLFCVESGAVSLTDSAAEKLRNEGKLEDWINRWQAATKTGMYERTPDQIIRLSRRGSISVDTLRPLVICVDFSDNVHTYTAGAFDTILFSQGFMIPTGSFRDYYLENSYGHHDPNGEVFGWVRAPHTYDYYTYGLNGLIGPYPHNCRGLVRDILAMIDTLVDFSEYDYDRDGYLDGLIFIHSGPGAEQSGNDWDIWSHRGSIPTEKRDGVWISSYTMQPEKHKDGSFINIGVFCHEWGHFLGIDWEEYDLSWDTQGLADWSVMATGWDNNQGKTPAHHSAYCKNYLGWLNIISVDSGLTQVEIPQSETAPWAYRLWKNGSGGSQFFLAENRQQIGFDSYLPGSGLLIYHVDEEKSNNDYEWCPGSSPEFHYKIALEQADGHYELEGCGEYGNWNEGDAGDPFPGSSNQRAFDDTTKPSTRDYYGNQTRVAIWNISNSNPVMYANMDVQWLRPFLFLDGFYFDDSTNGNGDGRAQPGETVKLIFSVYNMWADLLDAWVKVSVDTAGVSFSVDSVGLGDIHSGDTLNDLADPLEFTLPPGFPSKKVAFTLHICGNEGNFCWDFTVARNIGTVEILLVDDDDHTSGDSNYVDFYRNTLDSLGKLYDIWDKRDKSLPPLDLSTYRILIWFTGSHRDFLFSSQDLQALMNYLDAGGRLFLTSQDAVGALDNSVDPLAQAFLTNYLHVGSGGTCIKHLVAGKATDEVGEGLYIFTEHGFLGEDFEENLIPDSAADTVMVYANYQWTPTDSVAGIKFHNNAFRIVTFGFGLEFIRAYEYWFQGQNISTPDIVMLRILNWLTGSSDVFDLEDQGSASPKSFELYQSYPNPFNPSTIIRFKVKGDRLKVPIHTTLKVYNILGQVVRMLIDEEITTGVYQVVWDGKDGSGKEGSSGIYFYQLKVGEYSEVKKMVLLR